ncbi:WYL domain-containing protein [Streptomyces coffeae]|uniref:WYL domain-containing protein n=1 Tax=Streptomyces coffeae TaxID=621382 RepID=UPI003FD8F84F
MGRPADGPGPPSPGALADPDLHQLGRCGQRSHRCCSPPTRSPLWWPGCTGSAPGSPGRRLHRAPCSSSTKSCPAPCAAATDLATEVLEQPGAVVGAATVGVIADAAAEDSRLRFRYIDQHGRPSTRLVEPYRHGRWYLVPSTSTGTTGAPSVSTGSPISPRWPVPTSPMC